MRMVFNIIIRKKKHGPMKSQRMRSTAIEGGSIRSKLRKAPNFSPGPTDYDAEITVFVCVCGIDTVTAKGAYVISIVHLFFGGTRWRSWLRHCATSRKVAGSIP